MNKGGNRKNQGLFTDLHLDPKGSGVLDLAM